MEVPHGESVFVHERQAGFVPGFDQLSQLKAEQNALLHPGVHDPFIAYWFGGANQARGERVAQLSEKFAGIGILLGLGTRADVFDGSF